ncbi:hypothetical protein E8E13_004741 [Curvularia kusanoi]|uniref:Rhodopsin domain-containing protein n=1 Tax=Curvularia kusanoi TaxID=90978 RepID=A0A9P4W8D5_CURKU|nr:hypothetical protein E8E13_004741 [Curvularia kusanoi]
MSQLASWLLLLVQAIINQLTVNLGFGKHALDINFDHLDKIAFYGATGLTISTFAITLSKISFGVTLIRLTDGWPRMYVFFTMVTLAIFSIPTATLPWVLCKPLSKTFVDILPGTCMDKGPSVHYARFQAIWAALVDISLAILPWKILWGLQMRMAEKIGVCLAMSLGLLTAVGSIIRSRYVELLATQDLSYEAYKSVIWSAADSSMTIVAVSMPVLRVFVQRAVTSAIDTYNNSSRDKSRIENSRATATGADVTLRQSNKSSNRTSNSVEMLSRGSKGYLELEDLVVDETTGRVTVLTSEALPDTPEQKTSQWPLGT